MTEPRPETTTTDDTAFADRDAMVNEYLDLQASIEKRKIRLAELAGQLVDDLGVGGRWELMPGVGIRVQKAAAVFNADKAREVLTEDQYRSICELRPSAKLAEKMLPGLIVDQCRVLGQPSVRAL